MSRAFCDVWQRCHRLLMFHRVDVAALRGCCGTDACVSPTRAFASSVIMSRGYGEVTTVHSSWQRIIAHRVRLTALHSVTLVNP